MLGAVARAQVAGLTLAHEPGKGVRRALYPFERAVEDLFKVLRGVAEIQLRNRRHGLVDADDRRAEGAQVHLVGNAQGTGFFLRVIQFPESRECQGKALRVVRMKLGEVMIPLAAKQDLPMLI